MEMPAYIQLLRPSNALVAGIAAIVGYLMATGTVVPGTLLLLAIVFLVTGAGNAINDYYDAAIDRVNRPDRPIPSGRVRKGGAMTFSLVLFGAGILLSLATTILCTVIAVLNSALLIAYAASLKGRPGIGNLAISYLTASIFIFGGAYSGTPGVLQVLPIALVTFLAMLSRELWKDAEDVAGDIAGGAVTVPIRIGVRKTILLGFGFLAGAVLASFIPAFWWGPWYLGGIGLVDLFILATGVRALSCRDAACLRGSRVTTLVKYSMFASLAVFTLAAVLL